MADAQNGLIQRLRTWNRRRKIQKGYRSIAEAEMGKTVGFTPTMRTYELLERNGYVEIEDGEVRWVWP